MANVFLGLFKKAFPKNIFTLASQLWTKNTTFKYLVPSDATEKTSNNDVTSYYLLYGTSPRQALYNTTAWITEDGADGIAIPSMRSNNGGQYYMLEQHPALSAPSTPYYNFDESVRGIQGNKSYIAKVNDPANYQIGGIHLEDDGSGGLLIVAYKMNATSSGTDRVEVSRYSTAYNESITQSTITDFIIVGNLDYTGTLYETDVVLAYTVNGGTENINDLIGSNRQLSCDSTGRNIVFFTDSWDTTISNVIFEAVDSGTAITITKHSEIANADDIVTGSTTDTFSGSFTAVRHKTVDETLTLTRDWWTRTGSGSTNRVVTETGTRYTSLLGVAYSKYDDSLLILTKVGNNTATPASESNSSTSITTYEDEFYPDTGNDNIVMVHSSDWATTDSGFGTSSVMYFVNDDPVNDTLKSTYSGSGTGTSTRSNNSQMNVSSSITSTTRDVTINSFHTIDLSALLFAYEIEEVVNEKSGSGTQSNITASETSVSYIGDFEETTSTKIIVCANSTETTAYTSSSVTDSGTDEVLGGNTTLTTTTSSSDCPIPADTTGTCTEVYTINGRTG